jgi:hypothetical protein
MKARGEMRAEATRGAGQQNGSVREVFHDASPVSFP